MAEHHKAHPEYAELGIFAGYGEMDDLNKSPKPYFSPEECSPECNDPRCPYTHFSGWMIDGIDGLFESPEAAKAALAAKTDASSSSLNVLRD